MKSTALSDDEQRELASILWGYRAGLERIGFLLDAQRTMTGPSSEKGLAVIADLVQETAVQMGELDLRRALLLHSEGATGDEEWTLTRLATELDEPGAGMLLEHLGWFEHKIREIRAATDQSRNAMASTLGLLRQLVEGETAEVMGGYDRHGAELRGDVPAILFDGRV